MSKARRSLGRMAYSEAIRPVAGAASIRENSFRIADAKKNPNTCYLERSRNQASDHAAGVTTACLWSLESPP